MNYIDIKKAIEATGKSEKTIRRFFSKTESKPFVEKKDNKLLVDVNYLFASYPPIKIDKNKGSQNMDIDKKVSMDTEMFELKNRLALYEQEIKHKESLLSEKDNRIIDLQKAMLLLEASKEQEPIIKKRWWQV